MRLQLFLPAVDPTRFAAPEACPLPGCGGRHFPLHHSVPNPLRDTELDQTFAHQLRGGRCGHTFRVYPRGVSTRPTSRPEPLFARLRELLVDGMARITVRVSFTPMLIVRNP